MITLNRLILIITGLSGGMITSAGIVALINVVDTVPRLAARTKTAAFIHLYEAAIILGGTLGNLIYMYLERLCPPFFIVIIFSVLFAGFSGVFIGSLIMALAETLQIMPIYLKRVRLKYGMAVMIICFSIGKLLGSMWYFLNTH